MTLKEFIFALINFLILVFALYKIGRKMVVKIFATRRDKIRDSLEKSEQAKENAKQIAQKMETSREENARQCEQLTADAQKAGRERADAILRNGEASAQQTLQEVGELERQLRDEMQSKLARQTVTQVAALTGQALRSPAFDPYRAKLVDQDLTALRKSLQAYPSDRLRLQTQGLLQASVWSAEPLRAEERDSLRQMLQETFAENGRQYRIQLQTEVDPAQIAGLCLQVGDTVYDGTIRHQLELLTENIPPVDSAKGELLHSITEILQQADCNLDIYQVGTVTQVYDGICRISGLADCMAGEMLKFHNGIIGMVQDLEPDNVGCVLLGNYSRIQKGDAVRRTGHVMSVPVGDALIGRVVNALGEPVDGQGVIHTSQTRPIESPAPSVLDRQSVSVPLQTGLKAVDALVPIGRGQRELIIGDRQTGKTAIALDTIINQKGKDVICIYVAIGQKESTVAGVVKKLRQTGAMEYSIVVCAHASEAAPMLYIAPYAGAAMAEYFMYQGRDVLIVYDDLSKQAVAYREISLILQRPPGREAYPGDVFYLHSRLLERAARLSKEAGGGSITALPIIETQAGDISAYIPTNVISITDGQIFLETDLFHSGVRPAINVGLSVSRVGGAAQLGAMKQTAGQLRMDLAQYRELASFAQFGSDLDQATRKTLHRGERMTEILKQKQYQPMSATDQIIIIFAASHGYCDDIEVVDIARFETELIAYVHKNDPELTDVVCSGKKLDEAAITRLSQTIEAFKKLF